MSGTILTAAAPASGATPQLASGPLPPLNAHQQPGNAMLPAFNQGPQQTNPNSQQWQQQPYQQPQYPQNGPINNQPPVFGSQPQPQMQYNPQYGQPYPPAPQYYQGAAPAQQNQVMVINTNKNVDGQAELITCGKIMCDCQPPQFQSCQCCCGCLTCWSAGSGLQCCCCYGCSRDDCCSVYCAGCGMQWTSWFCYGIVLGCIVGWKMMKSDKKK